MSDTSRPRIGQIFADRYQLVEELGRGGFGVIFRARQRAQPHDVAVKVLFPTGAPGEEAEFAQRFEREALMAKSLQHPHTVTQYEYGQTQSGYFFIVMELLRGQTLAERIATHGPLPPALISSIADAVLQVLELAHSQQIVHRDIKPENIMLCRIGAYHDVPKLLDFGAAKTTQGEHDITSAGMTLGSPAYMAPEILQGQPPQPASDLYSLGLTLAETILGHKLVAGQDALARARAQLHPDPLPIPDALAQHPLYRWLSRAIQKPVAHRYSSAAQMRQALKTFASSPHPHSAPQRPPQDPGHAQRTQQNAGPGPTMMLDTDQLRPSSTNDPIQDVTDPLISALPSADPDATAELARHVDDDDDFDDDPTEFLQNPFHSQNRPQPTPDPAQNELDHHRRPEQRWFKSFASSAHKRREDDESDQSEKIIIEPSFETDFQTIKTYDKIKEGHTLRVIVGGLIVLLILILALYGSFPSG